MDVYLKISEHIYKVLCNEKHLNITKYDMFLVIIKELRRQIKGTSIVFKAKLVNIYEADRIHTDENTIHYDLSLIPSLQHREEFLLWLCTFIEKITLTTRQKEMIASQNSQQDKYALFYNEIIKVQSSSTKALEDYLKRINT